MQKYLAPSFIAPLIILLMGEVTPAIAARVSVTVAPYFSSHMVIQRDQLVPVWGTAAAGTEMTVSFQEQTVSAFADSNGKWRVELEPMPASGTPGSMIVRGGGRQITFTDVLVGDVWVLSGQSNINVRLQDCDDGPQAVRDSVHYPNLRLYLIPQTGSPTEQWEVSNPTNTPDWSGVGFFFAQELFDY